LAAGIEEMAPRATQKMLTTMDQGQEGISATVGGGLQRMMSMMRQGAVGIDCSVTEEGRLDRLS
jgi:hypothetical protein